MSTRIERDTPKKIGDKWYQKTSVYLKEGLNPNPIRIINKKVSREYMVKYYPEMLDDLLPESKIFDTNLIHAVFDPIDDATEYKAFCADARTSRIVNNEKIDLSHTDIEFVIRVAQAIATDGAITVAQADAIVAILSDWQDQVLEPPVEVEFTPET